MDQDFFSGLLQAIQTGMQGTKDAFQEDVSAVSEGRAPEQAIKAGEQVLSTMGNPAVNQPIPAMTRYTRVFDPQTGWDSRLKKYVNPGGDWLTMFMRQGGFGDLVEKLVKEYERNVFR